MKERIAIVDGKRSAFLKAGTEFKTIDADDIGAQTLRRFMLSSQVGYRQIDEVIVGNVSQPSKAANVARVLALKAGFSDTVPAYSVQRNCASGMEAVSTAINKILAGYADIVVAGGTESMTNIPFLYSSKMKAFFERLSRSRSMVSTLSTLSTFKLGYLKPTIGLLDGLTDPVCGQIMGVTAENLAKEFSITRAQQDEYALQSHLKALKAQQAGFFDEEIVCSFIVNGKVVVVEQDNGPRQDQDIQKLAKLRPYFDRKYGTVTVGNACPITDGAAMMTLMTESMAKKLKYDVLGYVTAYDYAGLEPHRMGLGPVYAVSKVLDRTGLTLNDIDLFEMNEAFAAQIIANVRAFESKDFAKTCLGKSKPIGQLDMDRFNIHGGAIALGHPVGATGARLLITLLRSLKQKKLKRGCASLCVGGGQGAAFIVEAD
tara:strand:+ start:522 stop:1811 length:1290 start_codon:yes stop_codon:yes gene_type:complete